MYYNFFYPDLYCDKYKFTQAYKNTLKQPLSSVSKLSDLSKLVYLIQCHVNL